MINFLKKLFGWNPNPIQNQNQITSAGADPNQPALTDVYHTLGQGPVPVGIVLPTPEELQPQVGADFVPRVLVENGDWRPLITKPFFQQYNVHGDLSGCVPGSIIHGLDQQINAWLKQPDFPQATRAFLQSQCLLNSDGDCAISELFEVRADGTTSSGTSETQVWKALQEIGVIAQSIMPFTPDTLASSFYDKSLLTSEILAIAAEFLQHFDFVCKTIKTDDGQNYNMSTLQSALQYAPVNAFIGLGTDFNNPESQPMHRNNNPCVHSVEGVFAESDFGLHILDQYPPFLKTLGTDYYLFYVFQTLVIPRKVYNMAVNTATRGYMVPGTNLVYVAIEGTNNLVPIADWQGFLNIGGTSQSIVPITQDQLTSVFNVIGGELFKSSNS